MIEMEAMMAVKYLICQHTIKQMKSSTRNLDNKGEA